LTFAVLARIPLGLGSYCAVFVFSWAFAVLGLIVLHSSAGPENDRGQSEPRAPKALGSGSWSD
jgi:hypothetical protein